MPAAPALALTLALAAPTRPASTQDAPPVGALVVEPVELATDEGARWPDLARGPDGTLGLLWTVPGAPSHLRLALRRDGAWGAPRSVAAGDDWFVNWADVPRLALTDRGAAVSWLQRLGAGTYAYGVRLARLDEAGAALEPRWLHEDRSPGEHGFVSLVPLADGALFSLWLDGRDTVGEDGGHDVHGAMGLATRTLDPDGGLGPEAVLDPRVCDCCPTDAALLTDGRVLAVWRDRGEDEVRDVAFALGRPERPDSWSAPALVHDDGWHIPACPVNGPAAAADGERAAVAWFTQGADGTPRVLAAFLGPDDAFGAPQRLDGGSALGRVDAAFLPDGRLVVVWLEGVPGRAAWRARTLSPAGEPGPPVEVLRARGDRADGYPSLVADGEGAAVALVDVDGDRVVLRRLAPAR